MNAIDFALYGITPFVCYFIYCMTMMLKRVFKFYMVRQETERRMRRRWAKLAGTALVDLSLNMLRRLTPENLYGPLRNHVVNDCGIPVHETEATHAEAHHGHNADTSQPCCE